MVPCLKNSCRYIPDEKGKISQNKSKIKHYIRRIFFSRSTQAKKMIIMQSREYQSEIKEIIIFEHKIPNDRHRKNISCDFIDNVGLSPQLFTYLHSSGVFSKKS